MNLTLRLQLSLMMFVQFFIWGAWYVTAPNYLKEIGFSGDDIGWVFAVGPFAGMISPFFVGMIADRFFAAQRVLGAMHLLGAGVMFFATTLMAQKASPTAIIFTIFAYQLTYFPTLALTNTLAMRNIADPEKEFPGVRVLGTIGWIVAGLLLSWLGWSTKINMFYLTAGAAVVLGLFSFALPHTPPTQTGPVSARQVLGLDALVLLKDRNYLTFMVASFLICIPLAFYYQISTDQVAPKHIRAQAQGLLVLFTLGLGMAIGAKVAGFIETQHTPATASALSQQMVANNTEVEQLKSRLSTASGVDRAALETQIKQLEAEKTELGRAGLKAIEWKPLWAKPAIFAAAILALFVLLFKNKTAAPSDKKAEAYAD